MPNTAVVRVPSKTISGGSRRIVLPLKGEICEQYVRCGKKNCHCSEGKLHGPYYYRVFREEGRVKKLYVSRKDLPAVRASIVEYRRCESILKELRGIRLTLTNTINTSIRRYELLSRNFIEPDAEIYVRV